jgi:hypothetical protein
MTTPVNPPATAGTGTVDTASDLDSASRAHQAGTARRQAEAPVDEVTFFGQLSFLVTIGYLSNAQADALIDWFKAKGATPLPAIPGPDGLPGPTMYEILGTSIHFGTLSSTGVAEFGILDDFLSALSGVGDLVETVCQGATQVLNAGTALIQAATALVQQLQTIPA